MANAPLSIPEKSALLALMMIGRQASNPEIHDFCGFVIEKPVRETLVDLKLIETEKSKAHRGAFVHELTEKGWQRCRDQLADETPPGAQKKDRLVYALARYLSVVIGQTKITFADLTEPLTVDDPTATVDDRVLSAYRNLAVEPGDWVGLAELREALPDVPRTDLDDALHRIAELPRVYFTPEVNQKTLTDADRDAAVHLGGEDKHLLSVEGT
jgi:hypothetical protein